MGLFSRNAAPLTDEGFCKEARERVRAALSSTKQQQDGDLLFKEPLPEDVYFDKSIEPAVPVHYACGMPLRRGHQHFTFKRCSLSWTHSPPESSYAPSLTISPTTSMSPEFNQPMRHPFQRQWHLQQALRASHGSQSDSSQQGGCASGSFQHMPQNREYEYDSISPMTSLPDSAIPPFGLVQDPSTAIHHRRDSGIGMKEHIPSFQHPFGATASTYAAVVAGTNTAWPIPPQQQHRTSDPPHQPHQHLSHLIHANNNTHNLNPKSPPAPPVLNLGSVNLFSPTITAPSNNTVSDDSSNAAAWRARTPVAELRDFFFERSAETGDATPVFYGTGGSDVSRGWRAKMGAEW